MLLRIQLLKSKVRIFRSRVMQEYTPILQLTRWMMKSINKLLRSRSWTRNSCSDPNVENYLYRILTMILDQRQVVVIIVGSHLCQVISLTFTPTKVGR